jgi:ammonia channel protein AmtB
MGLVGAPLCYGLVFLKNKLRLDEKPNQCDYPDAFGVHAIGGTVGAILLVRSVLFVCTSMRNHALSPIAYAQRGQEY